MPFKRKSGGLGGLFALAFPAFLAQRGVVQELKYRQDGNPSKSRRVQTPVPGTHDHVRDEREYEVAEHAAWHSPTRFAGPRSGHDPGCGRSRAWHLSVCWPIRRLCTTRGCAQGSERPGPANGPSLPFFRVASFPAGNQPPTPPRTSPSPTPRPASAPSGPCQLRWNARVPVL